MNTYVQNARVVNPPNNRHRKGHNWAPQKQLSRTWACRFPDAIAGAFTECQRADGAVIAAKGKNIGGVITCDLSVAEIAVISGCSVTTVQSFLHWARLTKIITVESRPIIDRFGNRL